MFCRLSGATLTRAAWQDSTPGAPGNLSATQGARVETPERSALRVRVDPPGPDGLREAKWEEAFIKY